MKPPAPSRNIACRGKRQWPDFKTAKKMADRTNDGNDAAVQPYRCRFCQKWHVGTTNHMPTKRPRIEPEKITWP